MTWVVVSEPPPFSHYQRLYVKGPSPIEFPSEEPLEEAVSETKRHLEARTTLYLLLKDAFADVAIGSDQFVYWDAGDPRRCLSPDVFVKLGARVTTFDNWKIWERGAPDLAVEIVSASDRAEVEWAIKLARYQASGIREVVRFDPANEAQPIRVWDRLEDELLERAPESAHLYECMTLGLWWAVAPSEYGPLLRLARDPRGTQLLPTPNEERQRLAGELSEERKARTLAEHQRMIEKHARSLAEETLREESAARLHAERERDAALVELAKLRAELAQPGGGRASR